MSDDKLRSLWDLETIGIRPNEERDCQPVLEQFEKSVQFLPDAGRYEVSLPWAKPRQLLKNNLRVAESRLFSLKRRLDRDSSYDTYDRVISDMKSNDFIEAVDDDGVTCDSAWYLPHHPVIKESSLSTKIRPVFDGSCPGPNGVSLNDMLDPGPSLLPNLTEVIIRFRRWRFALGADITKAFLQILSPGDRDLHGVYGFRRTKW